MTMDTLRSHRHTAPTRLGPASYLDIGTGPAALFIHGVRTSSPWRNVIPLVTEVDLVANDTGGAIAQVFAVNHPSMLR